LSPVLSLKGIQALFSFKASDASKKRVLHFPFLLAFFESKNKVVMKINKKAGKILFYLFKVNDKNQRKIARHTAITNSCRISLSPDLVSQNSCL